MESLGLFTNHLYLKQDPQFMVYSKSRLSYRITLQNKSIMCENQVCINLQNLADKIHGPILKI